MVIRSICTSVETKNKKQVHLKRLAYNDFEKLEAYWRLLSKATKKKFGPHLFDAASIHRFYKKEDKCVGYIATDAATGSIVAYAVIKRGCIQHDEFRLRSYGLTPDNTTNFSFAASVTDVWQNCGVGQALLHFILADIKCPGFKRILLWGGVQAGNDGAIHYYEKNNFKKLGLFEYKGYHYDMALDIT